MQVKSVQEMQDKTVVFTGTLTQDEHGIVLSYGLNMLMSLGLMNLLSNMDVQELDEGSTH